MPKLKLDLSSLRVESFEAYAGHAEIGTVRGNSGDPVESGVESCAQTVCATCLCPHSGPQPSCLPCSQDCDTLAPPNC